MKYKKIRVKSVDAPKRFYRLLYVREDLNLFQLGVTILSAFDCQFYHMFMFFDKKNTYVDKSWLDESLIDFGFNNLFSKEKDYEKYKISDLELGANNTFTLCYDTGDSWEFEIKIYKTEKDLCENSFGRLIEGAGATIWEDNRQLFWKYLDCGSDAISVKEKAFLLKMVSVNVEQFDDPIDIEYLNKKIDDAESTCEELLEMRDM